MLAYSEDISEAGRFAQTLKQRGKSAGIKLKKNCDGPTRVLQFLELVSPSDKAH
jgi:hypothetical protein